MNALAATLREQRLGALEATALLRKVMEEIDVAVFAFDGEHKLRLANRAGERLLGRPVGAAPRAERRRAGPGASAFRWTTPRVLELTLPGRRRAASRSAAARFRAGRAAAAPAGALRREPRAARGGAAGLAAPDPRARPRAEQLAGPHQVDRRRAWRSCSRSRQRPPDWEDDMRRGLAVIGGRAEALSRFMEAYARLARLPPPELHAGRRSRTSCSARSRLETRVPVEVEPGPDAQLRRRRRPARAAPDQPAAQRGRRRAGDRAAACAWAGRARRASRCVEMWVEDEGPGLPNTREPVRALLHHQAAGIRHRARALSRQIAEAHGGTLALENRGDARGCVARLRLPR